MVHRLNFLFLSDHVPSDRRNCIRIALFVGTPCQCRLYHYSVSITSCIQHLLHKDALRKKSCLLSVCLILISEVAILVFYQKTSYRTASELSFRSMFLIPRIKGSMYRTSTITSTVTDTFYTNNTCKNYTSWTVYSFQLSTCSTLQTICVNVPARIAAQAVQEVV